MKDLVKKFVRWFTAWAWRREISICDGLVHVKRLHAEPGAMEIYLQQTPEQAQWVAHCFAALVASSPNYTEMKFDVVAHKSGNTYEWITVHVQKGNGKTPHQLRMDAERERDELRNRLAPNTDHQ